MSTTIEAMLAQHDGKLRLMEAHDAGSMRTIEKTVGDNGETMHGAWVSGLTQTTYLGIPDTEMLSPLERATLLNWIRDGIDDISHPLCVAFDCDSGGSIGEVPRLVSLLAKAGVSMIIIEDKSVPEPGAKVNSLAAGSATQDQADMHEFAKVITAFASASRKFSGMMITARIESFTVRKTKKDKAEDDKSIQATLRDALARAKVYKAAGADAIMVHSKSKSPTEVVSFLQQYRATDAATPLVVVPTTYSETTEAALHEAGANVIIYANHLMRAKIQAVGQLSEKEQWQERRNIFANDSDLQACLDAKNFGCLMRKLQAKEDLSNEIALFLDEAEDRATENMNAVVKCLVEDQKAGAADSLIISVKDLLKINGCQVSPLESLCKRLKERAVVARL